MENRLETLESKIAHLERALDELNNVVYLQAQQLDKAQIQIQQWQESLSQISENESNQMPSPDDELPPHY